MLLIDSKTILYASGVLFIKEHGGYYMSEDLSKHLSKDLSKHLSKDLSKHLSKDRSKHLSKDLSKQLFSTYQHVMGKKILDLIRGTAKTDKWGIHYPQFVSCRVHYFAMHEKGEMRQ